jgi:hypothetical protein
MGWNTIASLRQLKMRLHTTSHVTYLIVSLDGFVQALAQCATTECSSSSDVETYGFFGFGNANSTDGKTEFLNQTLESPPLNISAYYIPGQGSLAFFGYDYELNDGHPFRDYRNIRWIWEQQVVNYTYVESSGQCQATKVSTRSRPAHCTRC